MGYWIAVKRNEMVCYHITENSYKRGTYSGNYVAK